MVMIETFIGMAKYLSPRYDDDWSDRLNYLMTPNILLALSVLISFKQFGGRPLECMFPNKFPGSWEQYAENYCWSQDTYFVDKKQHVELLEDSNRYSRERQLSYYQWVPFFLLMQAGFFRAPSFLWKYFCNTTGIRMHEVVEKARDSANVEEEVKEKNIHILVKHLKNALRFQRRIEKKKVVVHRTFRCLNFQYSSAFISTMYLVTKMLYLVNVVLQLWMMNYFLKTNKQSWYGYEVVKNLVNGTSWESSGYFPRSAVCDFEVRQVANIQKYSVQCVLVINIFNEKIFVFLWFWYLIMLFASFVTFFHWFSLLTFPCFSKWFVAQHLELSELENFTAYSKENVRKIRHFVTKYLRRDGVFVLRMVTNHAGIIFGTDLVHALWNAYHEIQINNPLTATDLVPDKKMSSLSTSSGLLTNRKNKKFQLDQGSHEYLTHLVPMTPEKTNDTMSIQSTDNESPKSSDDQI